MSNTLADLSSRAPLIEGVSHLYALSADQSKMLALMDDYCHSEARSALAKSVFYKALEPELVSALVSVAEERALPLCYNDNSYLEHLNTAALSFPLLGPEAKRVDPELGERLAHSFLELWVTTFAQRFYDNNDLEAVSRVLNVYPEKASEWADRLPDELQRLTAKQQRQRLDSYLQGSGPIDINSVASVISDEELKQLALSRYATEDILRVLQGRHDSPDTMLEAYLDALFEPFSGLHQVIPGWVKENLDAFRTRFLHRLESENQRGHYFGIHRIGSKLLNLMLESANRDDTLQLCLGTRRIGAVVQETQKIHWGAYHLAPACRALVDNPPQPGEWGPILKSLALCITRGADELPESLVNHRLEETVALLMNADRKTAEVQGGKMLQKCALRTLTSKQYLDDLAWPVDAQSNVIDYIPTVLMYARRMASKYGGTPRYREILAHQLDGIEAQFDRQRERLVQRSSPKPERRSPSDLDTEMNSML